MLVELELGNAVSDPEQRSAHCTFVVGAGYAGAETAAMLRVFTQHALRRFVDLHSHDLRWVLVDVAPRVLPELGDHLGATALRTLLRKRGIDVRRNVAHCLRGQPGEDYRHRDLGLIVDLGGTRSVARPLGHDLHGLPVQIVTRGYHLSALPLLSSELVEHHHRDIGWNDVNRSTGLLRRQNSTQLAARNRGFPDSVF